MLSDKYKLLSSIHTLAHHCVYFYQRNSGLPGLTDFFFSDIASFPSVHDFSWLSTLFSSTEQHTVLSCHRARVWLALENVTRNHLSCRRQRKQWWELRTFLHITFIYKVHPLTVRAIVGRGGFWVQKNRGEKTFVCLTPQVEIDFVPSRQSFRWIFYYKPQKEGHKKTRKD